MAKEDPRRCKKCGYQWWAVKVEKPKGLKWHDDHHFTGVAAARNVRKTGAISEQAKGWERYGICQRCGSQDIATPNQRGFVPTGLQEAVGAPPSPPSRAIAAALADSWSVGERVTIRAVGFRGKTGTISKKSALGGWNVDLDDGGVARAIDGKKLERLAP
jgi:hypothetical protein